MPINYRRAVFEPERTDDLDPLMRQFVGEEITVEDDGGDELVMEFDPDSLLNAGFRIPRNDLRFVD